MNQYTGQYPQVSISGASRRRLARHLVGLPLRDIERDLVLETLARTDGNRTASARLLGLSVRTLRNKITEYSADGVEVTPAGGAAQVLREAEEFSDCVT
jgi:DNA-binding NtrC family response regulator